MKTRIYKILAVDLSVSGAATIKVSAQGEANTAGWTGPELIPSAEARPGGGANDTVEVHLDFVAAPPAGVVAEVITPIAAQATVPAPGAGKRLRVVVHSAGNEESALITSPLDPL